MNNESTSNDNPVLLLVDDDEVYCEVLADALEKRDYTVSTAHNLSDALALARDIEPEYAVVDLRIGSESGLELVKQLAELDENTQIVMLTGYASVATAVESIKLGAIHYLTKPATADDVVTALHRKEGDDWNARYWHRRAGTVFPENMSLQEEWNSLLREMAR